MLLENCKANIPNLEGKHRCHQIIFFPLFPLYHCVHERKSSRIVKLEDGCIRVSSKVDYILEEKFTGCSIIQMQIVEACLELNLRKGLYMEL